MAFLISLRMVSSRGKSFNSPEPPPCLTTFGAGQPQFMSSMSAPTSSAISAAMRMRSGCPPKICTANGRSYSKKRICLRDFGLLRVRPSTEMNSETVRPMPPRRFRSARNGTSVTPAIGESTSGGSISTSRILNGLTSRPTSASRRAARGDRAVAPSAFAVSPSYFSALVDIAVRTSENSRRL